MDKGPPKQPATVAFSDKEAVPPPLDLPIRYRITEGRPGNPPPVATTASGDEIHKGTKDALSIGPSGQDAEEGLNLPGGHRLSPRESV